MRIYIPLDAEDLNRDEISARLVHGVTGELKSAVPGEDLEGWELISTLAAADDSFRRLASSNHPGSAPVLRRIVAVAEVSERALALTPGDADGQPDHARDDVEADGEQLPTTRHLRAAVPWRDVVTILVDEPGSEELVSRALAGDEQAFMDCGDIDLMWYDVVERAALAAELIG